MQMNRNSAKSQTTCILKALRKENDVTIKDMADLLGFKSPSAYCKKELMQVPFSLVEAQQVANFFNKRIEEIFL